MDGCRGKPPCLPFVSIGAYHRLMVGGGALVEGSGQHGNGIWCSWRGDGIGRGGRAQWPAPTGKTGGILLDGADVCLYIDKRNRRDIGFRRAGRNPGYPVRMRVILWTQGNSSPGEPIEATLQGTKAGGGTTGCGESFGFAQDGPGEMPAKRRFRGLGVIIRAKRTQFRRF